MKQTLLTLFLGLALFSLSCANKPAKTDGDSTKMKMKMKDTATKKYECPMKCKGLVFDKPGSCPECGMTLKEKK